MLPLNLCPFRILGLTDVNVSTRSIQSAWRKKSLDCHPDKRPGDPTAKAKFQTLTDAKEALLCPKRREAAIAAFRAAETKTTAAADKATGKRAEPRKGAEKTGAATSAPKASAASASAASASDGKQDGKRKAQAGPAGTENKASSSAETSAAVAASIFFRHLARKRQQTCPEPEPYKPAFSPGLSARAKNTRERFTRGLRRSRLVDGAGVSGRERNLREVLRNEGGMASKGTRDGKLREAEKQCQASEEAAGRGRKVDSKVTTSVEDGDGKTVCEEKGSNQHETANPTNASDHQLKNSRDFMPNQNSTSGHRSSLGRQVGRKSGGSLHSWEASGQCVLPPLILPATSNQADLERAVAAATGATLVDARVLARVIAVLRQRGGKIAISALSRKAPRRLQRRLLKQPCLFEIYMPDSPPEAHVRLQGSELEQAEASARRRSHLGHSLPSLPSLPPGHAGRKHGTQTTSGLVVDLEADDVEVICVETVTTKRGRRGGCQGTRAVRRARLQNATGWPAGPRGTGQAKSQARKSVPECVILSDDSDADDTSPGLLEEAFAESSGAWRHEQPKEPGEQPRRCFLLHTGLSAPSRLFAFDFLTKVLYEYLPSSSQCTVAWTPAEPEVNAVIWTVLPLPPEHTHKNEPHSMLATQIDDLICGAAEEAGVFLHPD